MGWCHQGVYGQHLEENTQNFFHDFEVFSKDKEITKISKVVVELENNFNLGVGEDDVEEPAEAVPEGEELSELEQDPIAEE